MNELIKVNYHSHSDRPTVLGRDLHQFLDVETEYRHWFPRMCEYGFTDGIDFRSFLNESTGGRPAQDHQITIDMAKEISMLQRKETTISNPDGSIRITKTPKVTGKGQIYFINRFLGTEERKEAVS